MTKKTQIILYIFLGLLAVLVLVTGIRMYLYGCFDGYDFGLVFQSALKFSSFQDLNPFINMRGLKYFNDHFDPIIFIPAIIFRIFGSSGVLLFIWEWVILMSVPLIIWLLMPKENRKYFLLILFLYLFSSGFLAAIHFPVHTSVWSAPLWALLTFFIIYKKYSKVCLVSFFLCFFFKESYPFAILTLSLGYLFFKKYKISLILFLSSSMVLVFIFIIRPIILGDMEPYGPDLIIKPFFSQPLETIKFMVFSTLGENFLRFFLPLLPLLIFVFDLAKKEKKREEWYLVLATLFPLFAIQFIAGRFGRQYDFVFYVMILSFFAYLYNDYKFLNKKLYFALIFLFSINVTYYIIDISHWVRTETKNYSFTKERMMDIDKAISAIKSYSSKDCKIVATRKIITRLIPFAENIYELGCYYDKKTIFDLLIFEKPKDVNFTVPAEIKGQILYESKGLLIVKGLIKEDLLNKLTTLDIDLALHPRGLFFFAFSVLKTAHY